MALNQKPAKISWNKEYVRSLTEKQFLEEFGPHYPDHNLKKEYAAIMKGKSPAAAEEEPEQPAAS